MLNNPSGLAETNSNYENTEKSIKCHTLCIEIHKIEIRTSAMNPSPTDRTGRIKRYGACMVLFDESLKKLQEKEALERELGYLSDAKETKKSRYECEMNIEFNKIELKKNVLWNKFDEIATRMKNMVIAYNASSVRSEKIKQLTD